MARLEVNRSGEMEVFVRVVERGGFSAAARDLAMTPSAVSKLVSRLEARLGARLVNRTTRKLQLTPEGCVFYERAIAVLAGLDEAERGASAAAAPVGRLRISVNVPVGRQFLLPLIAGFLADHPRLSVDITLTDDVVDLLDQRVDVAIRSGPLKDSRLMTRKLGSVGQMIVASPGYLAAHGQPRHPDDLHRHNRIGFAYARIVAGWPLLVDGRIISVPPSGNVRVSDGDAMRLLAITGVGLARLTYAAVRDDLAAGRLVPVLDAFNPGDREDIHALYPGQGGQMPARVRAFLDLLATRMRVA
ncbi:transcriptional regulator [Tistrella bauzanensis]|uniref:Transcriptional regulator n=1 Tax=Tistrella bauzanensis TaxID=657419 RepID=A0ABQ1IND3_9PROT|nr:LysR family transcriptional regulator [Tistrella bauzanensis]GGB45804.1 transcriptional regulator [Tistrella bauzanensis]